ncbi:ATP synthase [Actibacterium mucosum KCTC 23349]|uniref:ATP synthase n=1 Tax=Actibacterium mucosum KCTC 23349 TaxID=1454373 RepID=A0A037ZJV6_9RHOB|nr:methyltransferase domain-containing protein [Actibacterium mucosum]KAJ55121.1 ATP synthase [Actibacterium mucosum KCTC 23349]
MHVDVLDLRNFYYRTNLGRVAQRAIRNKVIEIWPEAKGQTVAGFGFAAPLLRPFIADARRVVSLMPGQQGVMAWPAGEENLSVLCPETMWPLPTGMVDKLILLHGLETGDQPNLVLEECNRVLGPGGRAMFIVPNRTGMWARRDKTPFGYGRPYSQGQLDAQLRKAGFQPEAHKSALFSPPSHKRFWLRSSQLLESMGTRVATFVAGGVLIVEVSKQAYRPAGTAAAPLAKRSIVGAAEGVAAQTAEPV